MWWNSLDDSSPYFWISLLSLMNPDPTLPKESPENLIILINDVYGGGRGGKDVACPLPPPPNTIPINLQTIIKPFFIDQQEFLLLLLLLLTYKK